MDKKDFSNWGDEIWSTVQDALNSRDFTRLKEEIKYTAENTLNEVRRSFKVDYNEPKDKFDYTKQGQSTTQGPGNYQSTGTHQGNGTYQNSYQNTYQGTGTYKAPHAMAKSYNNSVVQISKKPAGSVSSILYMVFGFLGTGLFGGGLIAYGIVNTFLSTSSAISGVVIGSLSVLFGSTTLMGLKGVKLRKRVNRFNKYVRLLGSRSFCTIKELASHIGESDKFVAKDLRKMIDLGMFPQGHIDEAKTSLLLSHEVYDQYLKAQESLKQREQEAMKKKKEEEEMAKDPSLKEMRETIESGKNYIRQIREANDAIPGEEISRKLDRLEMITEKIFNYVEKHPKQLPELHKLMNYYLPITLKLVNGYKDLDAQPVQGENIMNAKKEIEDTLDTISGAYEKLLDDLFQDIAFDISSDISVLETMLSKEGLRKSDFKK